MARTEITKAAVSIRYDTGKAQKKGATLPFWFVDLKLN